MVSKPKLLVLPKVLKKFTLLRAPFRHKLTKKNYTRILYKSVFIFCLLNAKLPKITKTNHIKSFIKKCFFQLNWFETSTQSIYKIDLGLTCYLNNKIIKLFYLLIKYNSFFKKILATKLIILNKSNKNLKYILVTNIKKPKKPKKLFLLLIGLLLFSFFPYTFFFDNEKQRTLNLSLLHFLKNLSNISFNSEIKVKFY